MLYRPRSARGAPAAAAALLATAAIVMIVAAVIGTLADPVIGYAGRLEALWLLSWPGMPVVGAVIVSRRPGNRVGWLLLGIGCGIALGLVYGLALMLGVGPDSSAAVLAGTWAVTAVGFHLGFGLVPLLVLHFPGGRLEGAARRWLARTIVALLTVSTLAWHVRDSRALADGTPVDNPLGPSAVGAVADAATGPLAVLLVAASVGVVVDAVLRHRRARGVERLQLRWFALAVGALPVMLTLAWPLPDGTARAVVELESDLRVAAATLTAAAAFAPLRRRVQSAVDRRFNRSRYDAQRLVEGFGLRVRAELDLSDLRVELGHLVWATVQAAHMSMWTAGFGSGRHP